MFLVKISFKLRRLIIFLSFFFQKSALSPCLVSLFQLHYEKLKVKNRSRRSFLSAMDDELRCVSLCLTVANRLNLNRFFFAFTNSLSLSLSLSILLCVCFERFMWPLNGTIFQFFFREILISTEQCWLRFL